MTTTNSNDLAGCLPYVRQYIPYVSTWWVPVRSPLTRQNHVAWSVLLVGYQYTLFSSFSQAAFGSNAPLHAARTDAFAIRNQHTIVAQTVHLTRLQSDYRNHNSRAQTIRMANARCTSHMTTNPDRIAIRIPSAQQYEILTSAVRLSRSPKSHAPRQTCSYATDAGFRQRNPWKKARCVGKMVMGCEGRWRFGHNGVAAGQAIERGTIHACDG